MLEKLNNDVELYKLHVKHYHMSSAQFRRRTSMLGLPGEIYDKYDRIVKRLSCLQHFRAYASASQNRRVTSLIIW